MEYSSWPISNPKRWCCECAALNMPANLENSTVATGLEKVSFHSNPKEGNAKECSNYSAIALISHASKVLLKILQARLQQYSGGTRNQIANICWIIEKQESSTKTSISALLTTPKALTVWITTNCGKFLKIWEYQTIWPTSWEIGRQVKKQKLELDMEQ